MGFPVLAFFLVSHLLVPHSSGSCPPSFNCSGPFDPMKSAFANYTHPLYGLCTVSCDEPDPKVIWGGIPYPVSNTTPGTVKINDPALKTLIKYKYCDFSSYIPTFYNTSSVSFTISPNLTIFKCNTSNHELRWEADEYFRDNPDRYYDGCGGGYTIYYPRLNDQVDQDPTRGSLPSNCHGFQLPSVEERGYPPSDLFSLLTSDFSIEYHLSYECLKCHDDDGGLCLRRRGCSDETRGRSTRMVWILGTVVPAIGIMVILLFYIIIKKLSKSESTFLWEKKTENYRSVEAFLKNCGSLSPKRYTYSDIKKITNSFRTKIGQGGFGCVFKGKLENDCLVAVKVLKGLKGNGEEFINEVATISRTSHVNIVTLLGFCFEGCHRALIYEFMPGGSLDKFIHDGGSSTYRQLGWEAMYRIAVGIARGLEYLHRGCNTRILHFDIKPHNILLNEDFCPKISDFGLAKLCPEKVSIISLTGARGTAGYIAPEVFCRNFGGISHKSDVYSYGMMVLEMVGGRKNISVEVDRTSEIYFPHWVYKRLELDEELGLHGIMDGAANSSARKMIIVGLWCIQIDPSSRPSMGRVVEMLEGSIESLQIPPKPYLSSPSRAPVDSSTTHVMTFL